MSSLLTFNTIDCYDSAMTYQMRKESRFKINEYTDQSDRILSFSIFRKSKTIHIFLKLFPVEFSKPDRIVSPKFSFFAPYGYEQMNWEWKHGCLLNSNCIQLQEDVNRLLSMKKLNHINHTITLHLFWFSSFALKSLFQSYVKTNLYRMEQFNCCAHFSVQHKC